MLKHKPSSSGGGLYRSIKCRDGERAGLAGASAGSSGSTDLQKEIMEDSSPRASCGALCSNLLTSTLWVITRGVQGYPLLPCQTQMKSNIGFHMTGLGEGFSVVFIWISVEVEESFKASICPRPTILFQVQMLALNLFQVPLPSSNAGLDFVKVPLPNLKYAVVSYCSLIQSPAAAAFVAAWLCFTGYDILRMNGCRIHEPNG